MDHFTIGFTLLLALAYSTPTTGEEVLRNAVDLPNKSGEGKWGDVQNCPDGSFVSDVRLIVKKVTDTDTDDETGVNGVEMRCRNKDGTPTGSITSKVLPGGEALEWKTCGNTVNSFIEAADLRDLATGAQSDKVAVTNMYFVCTNGPQLGRWKYGDRIFRARYSGMGGCDDDYAICGLQTKVLDDAEDNSGLNDVRLGCCKYV